MELRSSATNSGGCAEAIEKGRRRDGTERRAASENQQVQHAIAGRNAPLTSLRLSTGVYSMSWVRCYYAPASLCASSGPSPAFLQKSDRRDLEEEMGLARLKILTLIQEMIGILNGTLPSGRIKLRSIREWV